MEDYLTTDIKPYSFNSVDWEQRRYEIAKAVLPTLISLHEAKWDINKQAICFMAKEYADKLIEVLEKK